jgi:hypothetical protein
MTILLIFSGSLVDWAKVVIKGAIERRISLTSIVEVELTELPEGLAIWGWSRDQWRKGKNQKGLLIQNRWSNKSLP